MERNARAKRRAVERDLFAFGMACGKELLGALVVERLGDVVDQLVRLVRAGHELRADRDRRNIRVLAFIGTGGEAVGAAFGEIDAAFEDIAARIQSLAPRLTTTKG